MEQEEKTEIEKNIDNEESTPLQRLLLSSAIFLLCYISVYALYQLLVGGIAYIVGYKPIITYNQILSLPTSWYLWSKPRIAFTFGIPPFILLIGSIFFLVRSKVVRTAYPHKYVYFWLGIVMFHHFIVQIIGTLGQYVSVKWGLYQGLSVVAAWLFVPLFARVILAVLAIFGLLYFANRISFRFLQYYMPEVQSNYFHPSRSYYASLYLYPILISIPFILALTDIYSVFMHLLLLFLFVIISGLGVLYKKDGSKGYLPKNRPDVFVELPKSIVPITLIIWLAVLIFWR